MLFYSLYHIIHNLIKEKLVDFIERAFKKFYKNEGTLYRACNDKKVVSLLQIIVDIHFGHNVCDAFSYLLDNIYIRFDKLCRQILVFRWVQIVLLLWPICFYFVMKEIS